MNLTPIKKTAWNFALLRQLPGWWIVEERHPWLRRHLYPVLYTIDAKPGRPVTNLEMDIATLVALVGP